MEENMEVDQVREAEDEIPSEENGECEDLYQGNFQACLFDPSLLGGTLRPNKNLNDRISQVLRSRV